MTIAEIGCGESEERCNPSASNAFNRSRERCISFTLRQQKSRPHIAGIRLLQPCCKVGTSETIPTFEQLSTASLIFAQQSNPLYLEPPIGTIDAAVWDLTSEESLPPGVDPESVDIIILVFVVSALHPDEWGRAIANIHKVYLHFTL